MLPVQARTVQARSVQASSVQASTVASITLRATAGRKRAILFALPPLILVLVTALLKAAHAQGDWPSAILGGFGLDVVLPLTALIIGTSVLGAEIDDGSVVHLLATPVPRSTVILTKFAVATALTMVFAAVPEFLAGLIAAGGRAGCGRAVRRGAGRLGHLQRGVRDDLRAHHPGHRRGPAVPVGLGVAAGQRGQRGQGAVGRAVLAGHRQLDRAGREPERAPRAGHRGDHGRSGHRGRAGAGHPPLAAFSLKGDAGSTWVPPAAAAGGVPRDEFRVPPPSKRRRANSKRGTMTDSQTTPRGVTSGQRCEPRR